MLSLLDWLGDGRALTSTGQLRTADAQHLVEALGTGDRYGQFTGSGPTRVRSTAQLPELQRLLDWARCIRLVETHKTRLRPGPSAPRLAGNDAALQKVLFATVLRLKDTRLGWQWIRDNLEGSADFSAGAAALWRHLLRGEGPTAQEAGAIVWQTLTRPYQLDLHLPDDLPYWKNAVARDVVVLLELWQAVGAVEVAKDERVSLTAYGRTRPVPIVRDYDLDPGELGRHYIVEELSSRTLHPDGSETSQLSPAIWTLAHKGYSGSGRLDIWPYPSRKAALKAGADLAMACGMDEDAAAQSLYETGLYDELLDLYEQHHQPQGHILRVQAAFFPDELP